jgi:chromosome segregation ATPase
MSTKGEQMTTQTLVLNLEEQISQLEAEVAAQQSDTKNLQEALTALEAGKPRPATPAADDSFELLKQLVGSVPENLEQEQLYAARLAEAQRALQLALASVAQKQQRLDALRQQQREQQQAAAFEELKTKAQEFNRLIDAAAELLDSMRLLAAQTGGRSFEVAADLRELPYCSVSEGLIRVRRRFDVK